MNNMKVIFLDIDGVLNDNGCKTLTSSGSLFVNDNKIKILKEIIDRTGAKVVLSSTWRFGWRQLEQGLSDSWAIRDFIELRDKLLEYDIELYDKTPMFDRFMRRRGEEIAAWLDKHKDVDGYVIIDDLDGKWLRPCSDHLLQISSNYGLRQKHIKIAEKILNNER